jgi:hypothetical protein
LKGCQVLFFNDDVGGDGDGENVGVVQASFFP